VPKVTEAHLEMRREHILDAAIACFARNGFHQTTMADIATEARMSPGAIYRYFANKEDVIEASAQARRRARAERIQAAQQQGGTLQFLDTLVDMYAKRVAQPDAIVRLGVQLFGEALRNSRVNATLRDVWADIQSQLGPIIRRAQARGEINPALDANAIAGLFEAIFEGFYLHKTIDPDVDVWQYAEVWKALYHGEFWQGDSPASHEKS
jgi:AcrR family transcriptional regulator